MTDTNREPMEMKAEYGRFEDFKADILKWKDENREKYNRFAQMMNGCDERGFFLFYRTVARQMPQLVRQWELAYHDDTCPDKFAEINVLFKEQNLPVWAGTKHRLYRHCDTLAVAANQDGVGLATGAKRPHLGTVSIKLAFLRTEFRDDGADARKAGEASRGRDAGCSDLRLCLKIGYSDQHQRPLPHL